MNFIDILLGVLILYGIIKGFINGLFIEVASLLAINLGKGAAGIKREGRRARFVAQKGAGQHADMVRRSGVGA